MGGIIGELFGTSPQQEGVAQDPGQAWLQQQLQPLLQQGIQRGMSGQGLYPVTQAPQAPGVPDYNVTPYQTPQAPFSSPMDYLNRGEISTANNLMEQFMAGGGGGSAMGGPSGQFGGKALDVFGPLAQGAVGRYAQMQLLYDTMQNQQAQNVWNMQNQVWGLPLQQQNLGYTMGQIPQWQAQQSSQAAPWNLTSLYSGTYGSPMVGEEGVFPRYFKFWDNVI